LSGKKQGGAFFRLCRNGGAGLAGADEVAVGVVVEIGLQPLLDILDRHPFALGVALDLVALDFSNGNRKLTARQQEIQAEWSAHCISNGVYPTKLSKVSIDSFDRDSLEYAE
jgi:hypothetical protein